MKFLVIISNLILFITVSVFLTSQPAYAQKSISDSLHRILSQPMPDTARVLLYDQIARNYMYSNPLIALEYIKQGISMAERIKYPKGIARTKNRLGTVYKNVGLYSEAFESHYEALKVAKDNDDLENTPRILNNMGILYSTQKDYAKAIDYYKQAKAIAEQIKDSLLLEIIYQNLGADYAFLNELDSAQYNTLMAFEIARKLKENTASTLLNNLGNLEYRKKEYNKALEFYRLSLPVSKTAMDSITLSLTYFEMARVFYETNKKDSAMIYAEKALALAKNVNEPKTILDASQLLSKLYETTNQAKAFEYLKIAMVAKDRVFDVENSKAIDEINTKFNNMVVQEKIKEQQHETEKILYESRIRTIALLVGIGVFMIIAFLLYRNNRNRHKLNVILTAQKEELESTLSELKTTQSQLIQSEKMASLGELTAGIAHEIQNPLNFVKNYSVVNVEMLEEMKVEIEKEDMDEIKYLSESLSNNQQRIVHHATQAESIVRGMVEISKRANGNREATDINALATEYMRVAYYALQAKDETLQITLDTKLDTGLPKLIVIPGDMGKVFQNLIGNAFYAVIAKQKQNPGQSYVPTVILSTKKVEDIMEIRVADNGIGMSEKVLSKIFQPFFTTKPTGQGTGLGLSLAFDIITKGHGGKINVESKEGEGSEFIIQLPLNTQIPEPV